MPALDSSVAQSPIWRRHPRFPARIHTVMHCGDDGRPRRVTALDLSEGGMCLATSARLERGRIVWILMRHSLARREVAAEVVRGDERAGYGLQFVAADRRGVSLAKVCVVELRERRVKQR